ncbi:MAG: phosphatase [Clostridia bacterium]|nr:phosphatase [Clostridia bacterium]
MYRIECDTHTHTLYSRHAHSTIEENVRAAAEQRLTLLASTDHFGSMLYGDYDMRNYEHLSSQGFLPRLWHGITVLRGLEADIVDLHGHLFGHRHRVEKTMMGTFYKEPRDLDELVMARLDFAIASIHDGSFAFGATVAQGTEMYCKALENPKVFILGHICRSGIPFDAKELVQHAKKCGKLLEINEHSFDRKDNTFDRCRALAECCAEHNAPISVGSDAHVCVAIGHFERALAMLDEIGFPEDLIASRTKESFLSALKNVGIEI